MTDSHVQAQYQEAIDELFSKGLYIPAISLMDTFNIQLKNPGDTLFNIFVWMSIQVSHKDEFTKEFRSYETMYVDFVTSIKYIMSNYVILKKYLKKSIGQIMYNFAEYQDVLNILLEAENGVNFMDEDYVKYFVKHKSEEGLTYLHQHNYLTLELINKYMWENDVFLPDISLWNYDYIEGCLDILSKEIAIPILNISHFFNTTIRDVCNVNNLLNVLDKYKVRIQLNQDLIGFVERSPVIDQFAQRLMDITESNDTQNNSFVTTNIIIARFLKNKGIQVLYKKLNNSYQ